MYAHVVVLTEGQHSQACKPSWRQVGHTCGQVDGWRISHLADFVNTGQKRGGEAIWQLDASNFDSMPAAQRKRLAAQQLPGLPLLGKHGLLNG